MGQATIAADYGETKSVQSAAPSTGWRANVGKLLVAGIAGGLLALGASAGVSSYQAGVAAEQARQASAAQVAFIRSELGEAPAAINANGRAVVIHSVDERSDTLTSNDVLKTVPAFLKTERDEAPAAH